jgi:hypothetical protein
LTLNPVGFSPAGFFYDQWKARKDSVILRDNFLNLFIFFHVEENGTKRRRLRHEPFGFACASRSRPEAPKLALLIAGLRPAWGG